MIVGLSPEKEKIDKVEIKETVETTVKETVEKRVKEIATKPKIHKQTARRVFLCILEI